VLEVIEGTAEIWLGKESAIVKPNQSVLVPAGARHGFRNLENITLHVRATLVAPIFEASYGERAETSASAAIFSLTTPAHPQLQLGQDELIIGDFVSRPLFF
jgi:hypothetical protein